MVLLENLTRLQKNGLARLFLFLTGEGTVASRLPRKQRTRERKIPHTLMILRAAYLCFGICKTALNQSISDMHQEVCMYASQLWNLLTLSYVFAEYFASVRRLIVPKEYNGPGRVPQDTFEYKPT